LFYNNMGEVLFEKKWEWGKGDYKMDVSELVPGIYFYSIYGSEGGLKSGKGGGQK